MECNPNGITENGRYFAVNSLIFSRGYLWARRSWVNIWKCDMVRFGAGFALLLCQMFPQDLRVGKHFERLW